MFSSTPVWGILLGMSRKEPSSRAGINSFPTPGKVPARDVQAPVSRRFHPIFSVLPATKPNSLSTPSQIDRKSDMKGKSVSVRVVLGGNRFIKKKNTNTTIIHKN